jgi:hypothetical protein
VTERFRVGVSRDLRGDDGELVHDLSLDLLAAEPRVVWEFLRRRERVLSPDTIADYDALMVWEPGGVTAHSLEGADRLSLIARFGMASRPLISRPAPSVAWSSRRRRLRRAR